MPTSSESDSLPKTKKPSDSAFKQQRLPAWQPILTAGTVLPTLFIIGIAFIPVGIGLLYFSDDVKEHIEDYTQCISNNPIHNGKTCMEVIKNQSRFQACYCEINFTLPHPFTKKVYMYYGLSNFYQNHRRYVKSRDDNQLLGHLSTVVSTDCASFDYVRKGDVDKPIAPCGAIANSLFSDELSLYCYVYGKPVPLLKTGIAWPSDKAIKFKNPPGNLTQAFAKFEKPKNWDKPVYQLDKEDPNNNGFQNEDLIVWMRTAALPTFRKLYRRIDHGESGFREGLPDGNYKLTVKYSYQVGEFEGRKKMILSTTSLLGGKNPFLGIAYIVVGCLCLLLGVALLVIHIKCSKSNSDLININQNTPYQ